MPENAIGLSKEGYELVKKAAAKKGLSMRGFVDQLMKDVGVGEEEPKVILKIPTHLVKNNESELRSWLNLRMKAIMNNYYGVNNGSHVASS